MLRLVQAWALRLLTRVRAGRAQVSALLPVVLSGLVVRLLHRATPWVCSP